NGQTFFNMEEGTMTNYTKNIKTLLIAAVFASMTSLATVPAYAMDEHDAVVDSNGQVVVDSNGNCVLTMWIGGDNACGAPMMLNVTDERVIYFGFDSSSLSAAEKAKLDKLADILDNKNITDVKIVGYADRLGADHYNHKLSHRRADGVKAYLDSKIKLNSSVVEVRGHGSSHQVKTCDGMHGKDLISCLAPNRRVEVEADYTN
ncbi:MAG: OmpA family protein, partial [Legionellales bacterium]